MEHFTPLTATIGGMLLGIAATLLWATNGRLAGIAGIAGGLVPARAHDLWWRLAFLIGLPVGGALGAALGPRLFAEIPAAAPVIDLPQAWLIAAGLAVGVGTRVGGGCTSGHGICGLARLSGRSFAAVAVFMATAMATVFVTRHVL
jgi:uncharacterized membrane protein YedE/YeeE